MAKRVLRMFYVYTTGPVTLGATATVGANVSILADAPFQCHYITGTALQSDVIVLNWGGTVQIDDTGVGRTWFNNALRFDAIAGNARQPYPMAIPRLVHANSTLVCTFVNNVATSTVVTLDFHGYKLYEGEGPEPPER